jgi:hypothetical protein
VAVAAVVAAVPAWGWRGGRRLQVCQEVGAAVKEEVVVGGEEVEEVVVVVLEEEE